MESFKESCHIVWSYEKIKIFAEGILTLWGVLMGYVIKIKETVFFCFAKIWWNWNSFETFMAKIYLKRSKPGQKFLAWNIMPKISVQSSTLKIAQIYRPKHFFFLKYEVFVKTWRLHFVSNFENLIFVCNLFIL